MKSFKKFYENVATGSAAVGVPTSTNPNSSYDAPLVFGKKKKLLRRYQEFSVPTEVFRKFQTGRNKFERWSKYLNLEDDNQRAIYDFAKKNRKAVILLKDEETGAMRSIRQRSSNNL